MAEEIKVLVQQVESVLAGYEPARNSDKMLVWKVWMEYYGLGYSLSYQKFMEFPSSDIITRARRIIQNERGLYPPTDSEVFKERTMHIKKVKEELKIVKEETNEIIRCKETNESAEKTQIKMF